MKLSDIDETLAPKHIEVYGPPKSGKTLLALKMAEHGYNIWLIEGENGHLVGKQLSKEAQERVTVILLPDTKENPCMVQALTNLFKNNKLRACVRHGLDKCQLCTAKMDPAAYPWNEELDLTKMTAKDIVMIDTMTQWSNSIMAHIARKHQNEPDWNPEWDDWRRQGTYLDDGLGHIQNSSLNWIIVTHEIMAPTQIKGVEKLVPVAGTRNFSRNSAKYFDTVVYCEVANGRHSFASRTTYKNNIVTGDRMGVDIEKVGSDNGLLAIFEGDRSKNNSGTIGTGQGNSNLTNLLKK